MILMGIVGHKNAGKTTLTAELIQHLILRGLTVSTLKRTHHAIDLETPGTDTHRHRTAGAQQVILATDRRLTLMEEVTEPTLDHLLSRLAPCDVVLAEGWKAGTHPRLEVWRPQTGRMPLAAADPTIRAVAAIGTPDVSQPILPLDDIAAIAEFVCST